MISWQTILNCFGLVFVTIKKDISFCIPDRGILLKIRAVQVYFKLKFLIEKKF